MSSETATTVRFLKDVLAAAQIEGSRGKLDIFADRLVKAASAPTLASAMEGLLRSVNASTDRMYPPAAAAMMRLANTDAAPNVLRWLRDQAKMVTMLAATKDDAIVDEALESMVLPDSRSGTAARRQAYAIPMTAHCETPMAHGSDGKAGNATLFRRIDVLATNGAHLTLPYYAGNAIRGQVRDLLADHMLTALGLAPDRSKPSVAMWFFYAIYSGGALEEKSDAMKAVGKMMGTAGAIRADGIRVFREHIPALSLLGCALGNRVLPGHVQFADLRPVCAEWGTGTIPMAELLTWEFLTRREDYDGHTDHHGMIASTEVLRAGVELEGGVDMDASMPEMERSALGCGLSLLARRGMIGAENRRGLGRVRLDLTALPDPDPYEAWLQSQKAEILAYLGTIGALT